MAWGRSKGEDQMKESRSGIKICRREQEENRRDRGRLPFFCLQMLVVCFLMAAWWNAFLSVFHMPFQKMTLYGGTFVLTVILGWAGRRYRWKGTVAALSAAAAVLWLCRDVILELYAWIVNHSASLFVEYFPGETDFGFVAAVAGVPVTELFLAVQRKGRGKGWAALVISIPFFAAAAAGYFQSPLSAWLLVAASAVYLASVTAGAGQTERKTYIWKYTAIAAALAAALALVSSWTGKLLDDGKKDQEGYYLTTRSIIEREVIQEVENFFREQAEQKEQGETEEGENKNEEQEAPRQEEPTSDEQGVPVILNRSDSLEESGMDDLGSLAYFRPAAGELGTIVTDERPSDTFYVEESWGITYRDNSWSKVDRVRPDPEPPHMLKECRLYPEKLSNTLEEICGGWNVSSFETVGEQINRELSRRAVYDTNPGPTPAGEDFVEYFLLENQKGFCVHFATTAVLMYRYCGYMARYVEGYAVPASAFRQNESGKYEAVLTGDMGHAWCQVYDEQTEEWINEEHTPPAPEHSSDPGPAAHFAEKESQGQKEKLFGVVPVWLAVTAGLILLSVLLFFGQASVRSACRKRRFYEKTEGKGIREMYVSVIKTARFQGVEIDDPLGEDVAERLWDAYREIKKEDWMWMYTRVMEDLFYRTLDEKKEWKKMKRLYDRFRKAACKSMKPSERWRFKYILCL